MNATAQEKKWISLREAGQIMDRTPEAIRKRIMYGIRVRGTLIKLKARRNGAEHETCQEWIDEFLSECLEAGTLPEPRKRKENPSQLKTRLEREKQQARAVFGRTHEQPA